MQKYINGGDQYWDAHKKQQPYLERLKILLEEIKKHNDK
jgi:hypothetical protein